ncbi:MAG: hypothetical protein HYV29_16515, partial [Ignavibacteriales bacterium]|nr:hypothetical protein [Ignavibacteriales bacterium]
MKKILLLIFLGICGCSIQSSFVRQGYAGYVGAIHPDSIMYTILLIGDAGEPLPDGQE